MMDCKKESSLNIERILLGAFFGKALFTRACIKWKLLEKIPAFAVVL
jgi:hypothetical protein